MADPTDKVTISKTKLYKCLVIIPSVLLVLYVLAASQGSENYAGLGQALLSTFVLITISIAAIIYTAFFMKNKKHNFFIAVIPLFSIIILWILPVIVSNIESITHRQDEPTTVIKRTITQSDPAALQKLEDLRKEELAKTKVIVQAIVGYEQKNDMTGLCAYLTQNPIVKAEIYRLFKGGMVKDPEYCAAKWVNQSTVTEQFPLELTSQQLLDSDIFKDL